MQINFSNVSQGLARTFGDAECIVNVERQRRYTFSEFHLLTNRIVNMMRDRLGLKRGDVWLTILNNDNLSLLSAFTALKGESCACYANTTDSLPDQARQIVLVKSKLVFIEAELLPTHYALLSELNQTIVSMDPAPTGFPDVLNFWDLMEDVSDENPNISNDDRKDVLALRFTGGTTGPGKAVMYCTDTWMANKDLHFATPDAIPVRSMRLLHFGMISHASGIVQFPVMFRGGCNITMNDRSLLTWCQTVEREKVTGSLMVPSMLYRLLAAPEAADHDLSSLTTMYYGASAIIPTRLKELRQRFGNIFIQIYGSSEHCGAITCMSIADHLPDATGSEVHFASAGRVVPGVEVLIVGRDGKPVPDGQDGELWVRSRAISPGYLYAPEKTAEEFHDGFWKSGDFGRLDANGYLYVLDRVKDTIACNDKSVYPSKVEAALCSHPKVSLSVVVGLPNQTCGEEVYAEVVLRHGEEIVIEELHAYLADKLPSNDRPVRISIVTGLPMTPVGKVLRRVVRDNICKKLGIG